MKNFITSELGTIRWVKQLPSSTALLDKNLQLVDASTSWFKTFNFDRTEANGKPFFELFPECDENWEDSFDYAFEGLNDIKIIQDFKIGQHNGNKKLAWKINPWKDGYGKCIGIILHVEDLSKKTASQLELIKTQEPLKEKNGMAKIGSWEYNTNSQKLYFCKESHAILNRKMNTEDSFQTFVQLFKDGEHRHTFKALFLDSIKNGTSWNKNLQIVKNDGKVHWVNVNSRPKFKNGECVRVIGTIQNIEGTTTEQNIPTQISKDSPKNISLDQLPIGMAVVNFNTGEILSINKELINIIGLPSKDFVGNNFKEFLWFTDDVRKKWYRSILANGSFKHIEKEVFTKNLSQKLILRLSGNLYGESEERYLLVSCEDVTTYHLKSGMSKAELDSANDELERLTHFMHTVSHDLKGHATNFGLLLNFLGNEKNDSEKAKLLEVLQQSKENLTSSIKGLRELVTVRHTQNGKKEWVEANDIIYQTMQDNNGLIRQLKVKIHNEVTDGFKLHGIPVFLQGIISNLLISSIKFKNDHDVPVIFITGETTDKHNVITIEDNGVGLDLKKEENKLFALYKTLQNMDKSSGIGLYLAKYQMNLMGGKIVVESQLNEGTRFVLYFPKK